MAKFAKLAMAKLVELAQLDNLSQFTKLAHFAMLAQLAMLVEMARLAQLVQLAQLARLAELAKLASPSLCLSFAGLWLCTGFPWSQSCWAVVVQFPSQQGINPINVKV